jgi:hypothetical protein
MRIAKKKKKNREEKKMELALAFLVVIPSTPELVFFGLLKPANQKPGFP